MVGCWYACNSQSEYFLVVQHRLIIVAACATTTEAVQWRKISNCGGKGSAGVLHLQLWLGRRVATEADPLPTHSTHSGPTPDSLDSLPTHSRPTPIPTRLTPDSLRTHSRQQSGPSDNGEVSNLTATTSNTSTNISVFIGSQCTFLPTCVSHQTRVLSFNSPCKRGNDLRMTTFVEELQPSLSKPYLDFPTIKE